MRKKPNTLSSLEQRIMSLIRAGNNKDKVAFELGCSFSKVADTWQKNKRPSERAPHYQHPEWDIGSQALELYKLLKSYRKVADALGFPNGPCHMTVKRAIARELAKERKHG